jgi:phosphoribosyl-AMP cyclohydrolase / phosphoribosyl-ATP pyrophosphohydrolase
MVSEKKEDLIPAVVQDARTGVVLMVGYMNDESIAKTRQSGLVTFYSRSKKRLWTKGETSGNTLTVKEILLDCDKDTYLIKAVPHGSTCHTGADTCFDESNQFGNFGGMLARLEKIIQERKSSPEAESYTSLLFEKGVPKIAQKVGEEAVEVVIEAMRNDNKEAFLNESADLIYHYLVLLCAKGYSLNEVLKILEERNKA